MYWVYVLELVGGRRYVGFSKDLGFRIQQHIDGRGARATRQARVVDIHLVRKHNSLEAAMQGERDEFYLQCSLIGHEKVSMGKQFRGLPLVLPQGAGERPRGGRLRHAAAWFQSCHNRT
jgi:hypothetical protein